MGKLKTLTGYATFIGLIAMWLLLFACKDDEVGGKPFDPSLPVTINSIVPDSGGIATPIVIKGHNFGTDKSKVQVFFDDREAVVVNGGLIPSGCVSSSAPYTSSVEMW